MSVEWLKVYSICPVSTGTAIIKDSILNCDGIEPSFIDLQGTKHYYTREGQQHRIGGPAKIFADGSVEWWENGQLHRDDDLPALIHNNSKTEWRVRGILTRSGGLPTRIWNNGTTEYHVNGELHRDGDKPAIEYGTGQLEYWFNGKLHRGNGKPAITRPTGDDEFYIHGKKVTEEQSKARYEMKMLLKKQLQLMNATNDVEYIKTEMRNLVPKLEKALEKLL